MAAIHAKLPVKNVSQVLHNVLHVSLVCIRMAVELVLPALIVHPHASYVMIKTHAQLVLLDTPSKLVIINVTSAKLLVSHA